MTAPSSSGADPGAEPAKRRVPPRRTPQTFARRSSVLLAGALLAAGAAWSGAAALAGRPGTVGSGDSRAAGGRGEISAAAALRRQLRRERAAWARQRAHLAAAVLERPSVTEAIHLAATVYGADEAWMRAIIWRESNRIPGVVNTSSGACGLAQALPSTWAASPFAGFDCRSAYASALFMAWAVTTKTPGWGKAHWRLG